MRDYALLTLGTTMNELPKVLPVWTNAAEQGLADLKVFAVDSRLHPDYGGAGVDVSVDGRGDIQCTALKHHDAKSTRLCARNITLPFGLPNTVLSLQERCLQPQLDLNERIDFYELSLLKDRPWARRQAPLGNCVQNMLEAVRTRKGKRPFENMKIHYGLQDLFEARPTSMQYRECNWGYTGGCLALVPAAVGGGTTLLCHPCGVDLNNLAISELSQNEDPEGPLVQKTGTVVLQKPEGSESPIFQVCTRRIEDEICCCIRLEDRCQYVRLYDSVGEDPMVLADFSYDDTLCFVMPSTYILGELLSVTQAGTILLQNCEDREPTWQATASHEVENCDQWWCCDFGSHPRSVLFMDHVAVYALDARSSGARRRKLCSVERDPFLNDKFTLFRQNPVNLHQVYLASSLMLSLWDERYPMQPMLTWNHGLKYSPTFLDAVAAPCGQGSPRDLYLTLGSQRSREVAVFSVSQESTSLQPVSLLPPWHLSKPCDFSNQLVYQGCKVEAAIVKRVTAPLIGACVVTCSGGSLSALQLTSFGDLFCQSEDGPPKSSKRKSTTLHNFFQAVPKKIITEADIASNDSKLTLKSDGVDEQLKIEALPSPMVKNSDGTTPLDPAVHTVRNPAADFGLQYDIGNFVGARPDDHTVVGLLEHHWMPPQGYSFPFSEHNKGQTVERRYVRSDHLLKYPWLVVSDAKAGLFCKFCPLFATGHIGGKHKTVALQALVTEPLKKFAKLLGKDGALETHSKARYHIEAVEAGKAFLKACRDPARVVANQIDTQRMRQVSENRARLVSIVDNVVFLARQNIAFRGHRDDGPVVTGKNGNDSSENGGNFKELLRFRVKCGDHALEKHLSTATGRKMFTSKTTQNALIECCGDEVLSVILARVRQSKYYGIMFDETTDVAHKELLARPLLRDGTSDGCLDGFPCQQLSAECLACQFNYSCVYGEEVTVLCEPRAGVKCANKSPMFERKMVCRYCYQTPSSDHVCEHNSTCQVNSAPRQRYIAQCTVRPNVLCLGRRTFLKNNLCNWTRGYSWWTALLLSIVLGGFGADRFYLGMWQEGIGKLFSFGGLGVWTLVDVVLVAAGYLGPADGSLYIS
ncbi:hypothetical protein ISCGN_033044 [Ixodes scapularis]